VEISVFNALKNLPLEVVSSFIVFLFVVFSVVLFWKELSLLCFDRGLCQSQGFKPILLELFLLILVSVAVVASFKIVGSILVVALLVVPPACARLLTNSLRLQFLYSLVFAMLGVIIGYGLATRANLIFNINGALNVAGSVASVLGLMFILVSLLAPIYGIIPRLCRNYLQRIITLKEDILGLLYRSEEGGKGELPLELFLAKLYSRFTSRLALFSLVRDGQVAFSGAYRLTEKGRDQAKELVRSHRLWEVFLSSNIGLDADHVHSTAENLEHIRSPILEKELEKISKDSEFDPHGKPIPKN
jgi:manganese/zinc/iron transport system permease protein